MNKIEEYKKHIGMMLESANEREVDLIYRFIMHLVAWKCETVNVKAEKAAS